MKKPKALALLSGGLDSVLAAKIVKDMGVEVIGINFTTPFLPQPDTLKKQAEQLGIKIKTIHLGKEYLIMLKHPKHGYGSAMNPCIDCHIFFLKQAKKLLKPLKADFIITGEVMGQRPMSQQKKELLTVEKESGLKGKLLRPLSAKFLEPTEAEKKIDRSRLLDIQGRSRKIQLGLAGKYKITAFQTPAGGCILTNIEYANKLKDLIKHNKLITEEDISLLKIGRHFRYKNSKIIVGRNHEENQQLTKLKSKKDILLEPLSIPGPTTLIQNPTEESILLASGITARYSDNQNSEVKIKCKDRTITAKPLSQKLIEKLRLSHPC